MHLHLDLHHDDGGRRRRHPRALDHEAEVARHEGHDAEGQGHDGESHRGSALSEEIFRESEKIVVRVLVFMAMLFMYVMRGWGGDQQGRGRRGEVVCEH